MLGDLSAGGRVCAYDRAGLGRSPPNDLGVGVIDRGRELGRLLDQIGETDPVILIGHSNGALYAEAFARLYPERVAGLVYINGVTTDARDDPRLIADLTAERRMSNASVTAARLGLAPLVADKLVADADPPPGAAAAKRQGLTCHACLVVARDEDRAIIPGLDEVARLDGDPLKAIPTVVITGAPDMGEPVSAAWRASEEKSARRAEHGWVLEAPGASHVSPLARDRDYIDAAVGWLRSITRRRYSASTPTARPASAPRLSAAAPPRSRPASG